MHGYLFGTHLVPGESVNAKSIEAEREETRLGFSSAPSIRHNDWIEILKYVDNKEFFYSFLTIHIYQANFLK